MKKPSPINLNKRIVVRAIFMLDKDTARDTVWVDARDWLDFARGD